MFNLVLAQLYLGSVVMSWCIGAWDHLCSSMFLVGQLFHNNCSLSIFDNWCEKTYMVCFVFNAPYFFYFIFLTYENGVPFFWGLNSKHYFIRLILY